MSDPLNQGQLVSNTPRDRVTRVSLTTTETSITSDQALWVAIRNRSEAVSFARYYDFIENVLCRQQSPNHGGTCSGEYDERQIGSPSLGSRRTELSRRPALQGVDAYDLLRLATEIFLLLEAGVIKTNGTEITLLDERLFDATAEEPRLGERLSLDNIKQLLSDYFGPTSGRLPYLDRILEALPFQNEGRIPYCTVVLEHRLSCPSLLELIWSYWHEEGMLVQTMKTIALRFQNRRGPRDRDPLASLELDPLRPLNNLLWGYIQEEYRRLSVLRRAYEYDHHYGLTLAGKAVPATLETVDSRSKFIEGFHNLLYRAAVFHREDADTTVVAEAFPLLNTLKEVHLLLAEGAHNQFGEMPWTSRVEMLIEQWLLARKEMAEFLRGRYMVPYEEPWMGAVDTMKRLQGWTDVSVTHFRNLAVFGERLLLSVRYGDWNASDTTAEQAKNWARYWKLELQGYIHAYQAATGVDLSADMVSTGDASLRYLQPSVLLARRFPLRRTAAQLAPRPAAREDTNLGVPPARRPRLLGRASKE